MYSVTADLVIIEYSSFSYTIEPRDDTAMCFLFDSLRPINTLSVKQGRIFLGRTSTELG